jgi:hypothetical protein
MEKKGRPFSMSRTYLIKSLLVENDLRDQNNFWSLTLRSISLVLFRIDLDPDPPLVSLDTALEGNLNWGEVILAQ